MGLVAYSNSPKGLDFENLAVVFGFETTFDVGAVKHKI